MKKEKVVLAYSGGLDTSVILKWLCEKNYDVICFVGDVGQKEDFQAIREKALQTGASKVYMDDLKEEFVTGYIFPALKANAVYEGRYLLGTALARPLLAKRQIEIAAREEAQIVAHGATGKGNDQVRFELTYYALNPKIQVIAPWKMPEFLTQFQGRPQLLAYAEKHHIPVKATAHKPYSEDENLMHVSHEAGILEDPAFRPPGHMYSMTCSPQDAPDCETLLEVEFKNGAPVKVVNLDNGETRETPLELFLYLNDVAGRNGVGRTDIVENRFIGIKSRGVYEAPAATVLWAAHRDLECLAMDREVMRLRDMLTPKFAELVYNGLWFSPEADFLLSAFSKSQESIDGKVTFSLYKGNIHLTGRESQVSLYDKELSSMDIEGGFNAPDAEGFIKINAIRLKAHHVVLRRGAPYEWRSGANL